MTQGKGRNRGTMHSCKNAHATAKYARQWARTIANKQVRMARQARRFGDVNPLLDA